MQLAVNITTRVIEQIGEGIGERAGCAIVTLDADTLRAIDAALAQPHDVVLLGIDGVVTVRYDQATHDARAQAQQAAEIERTTATADLRVRAAAALTRTTQIEAEMTTAATNLAAATTLAQAKAALAPVPPAVGDLAQGLRLMLRLLRAQAG